MNTPDPHDRPATTLGASPGNAPIRWNRILLSQPLLLCLGVVGLMLGGLLVGFEPVGGDPDRMYRPLKQEAARFFASGTLPWWSDRVGLGLPLLAESHVAALYPPNWALYSLADVSVAYRLAMWFHYVLLAAGTYCYARFLEISPIGSALAGLAFPFCGFQAIHSSHEPFYHALAYLPIVLLAAEWYLERGATLALWLVGGLWGLQLTLGHFQLQWWTAGLVLFLALWRVLFDGKSWTRGLALGVALALGAGIASAQLAASWELAGFIGFRKLSAADLAFFSFPAEHWAELAIPGLFRGIRGGPESGYWNGLGTTGYEACFYVGTIPLILAILRLARGIPRALAPWLAIGAIGFLLAILPRTWPAAQLMVSSLPGFGWFRAPGRYVVLTSFSLCLLAGTGLEAIPGHRRLRLGWFLVACVALLALGWSLMWTARPRNLPFFDGTQLAVALGTAGAAWILGATLIVGWQRGRVPAWVLILATSGELGWLYYTSTTVWGWAIQLPDQSRMLATLAAEPGVGRVAGLIHNLPIRAGTTPVFPYTGFAPPPPHPFLDLASPPVEALTEPGRSRLLRYGVTHGLWDRSVPSPGVEVVLDGPDPTLDRLVVKPPGSLPRATWRLVRYRGSFPEARCATRRRVAPNLSTLLSEIGFDRDPHTVWFLAGDPLPPPQDAPATDARVESYDGRTAIVEHDGSCDLVVNRTYYPGWFASVNGGLEVPVSRAELGIQTVPLAGRGRSTVRLTYRPATIGWSSVLSISSISFLGFGLLLELARALRSRNSGKGGSPGR